jgi:DNA-binding protein H-NS
MAQSTQQAKLCPHCANSIGLDAMKCPYCKAQLSPETTPEWAERNIDSADARPLRSTERRGIQPKMIAVAAIVLLAVAAAVGFIYWRPVGRSQPVVDHTAELRDRDQKIQTLEAELAKLREQNQGSSNEVAELKRKLDDRQKQLAAAEKRLTAANRETDRLQSSRAVSTPRPASRRSEPPASPPAARTPEPGVYETVRNSRVFEEPASSARVLTEIARGTQVTVVGSSGEWLEVRSKHGKPPGFIRADDARVVARTK